MEFNLEKIYEDEFITVQLDKCLEFIHVTWLQHPDSYAFRRCFILAGEIAILQKCRYWLSDSRSVHYLEFADQNWVLNHMVPFMRNSALTRFARITSEESLGLMDTDRILHALESSVDFQIGVEIAIFVDKQEALKWLLPTANQQQGAFLPQKWLNVSPQNRLNGNRNLEVAG